jgi:hypothetical protein
VTEYITYNLEYPFQVDNKSGTHDVTSIRVYPPFGGIMEEVSELEEGLFTALLKMDDFAKRVPKTEDGGSGETTPSDDAPKMDLRVIVPFIDGKVKTTTFKKILCAKTAYYRTKLFNEKEEEVAAFMPQHFDMLRTDDIKGLFGDYLTNFISGSVI